MPSGQFFIVDGGGRVATRLVDVDAADLVTIEELVAEQVRPLRDAPALLRVLRLKAHSDETRLRSFITRIQKQKKSGKIRIDSVSVTVDGLYAEVSIPDISASLSVAVTITINADEYGGLEVAFHPVSGALGWMGLPFARIAIQALRRMRGLSGVLDLSLLDENTISIAARLDLPLTLLDNLDTLKLDQGRITVLCRDPVAAVNRWFSFLSGNERMFALNSGTDCSCPVCLGTTAVDSDTPGPGDSMDDQGWFASLYHAVAGPGSSGVAGGAPPPDCLLTVDDLFLRGRFEQARRKCEALIRNRPDDVRLLLRHVETVGEGLNDIPGAISLVDSYLERHRDDVELITAKARFLAGQGRLEQALDWLEDQAAVRRENFKEQAALPRIFAQAAALALERPERVDRLLAFLDETEPDGPDAQWTRGRLAQQRGDLDLAVEHYERALERVPFHVPSLRALASLLTRRRQVVQARGVWKTLLLVRPFDADASRNIGLSPGGISGYRPSLSYLDEDDLKNLLDLHSTRAPEKFESAGLFLRELSSILSPPVIAPTGPPSSAEPASLLDNALLAEAFARAKAAFPGRANLDLYSIDRPGPGIVRGRGWIALQSRLSHELKVEELVFLFIREMALQEIDPDLPAADDYLPSLVTMLAGRLAALSRPALDSTTDRGLVNEMLSSRLIRNDIDFAAKANLDSWIPPGRQATLAPLAADFVDKACTAIDVWNVLVTPERAADRAGLAVVSSLWTAVTAVAAAYLDPAETARARHCGPARVIDEFAGRQRFSHPCTVLCDRVVSLCRFARDPLLARLHKDE